MEWSEIYRRQMRDRNDDLAYAALERRVHQWAAGRLWHRGWHVVEDVVAESCANALVSIEKARGGDTFSGFVYGHFLNALKHVPSQTFTPSTDGEDQPYIPPRADLDDSIVDILKHCLDKLPPRERRAVEGRYFREEAMEEVATALDVNGGNARRILFNARAHLRQCIERTRVSVPDYERLADKWIK
jgi:RNA polymerase sigma factor (sigma-70 family)